MTKKRDPRIVALVQHLTSGGKRGPALSGDRILPGVIPNIKRGGK